MGVVHHHAEGLAPVDALQAARSPREARHPRHHLRQGETRLRHRRKRGQQVVGVEASQQGTFHLETAFRRPQGEAGARGRQAQILGPVVRGRFQGVALHPGSAQQAPAPGIIGVHQTSVALVEEPGLGLEVGLQGAVVVQMVLSEVGKHPHLEAGAVHPAQAQGVAAHLHRHGRIARRGSLAEPAVEHGAFRGCANGLQGLPPGGQLHRAHQAAAPPHGAQELPDEHGGRGLAVGARDTDQGQALVRRAVHPPRQQGHGLPGGALPVRQAGRSDPFGHVHRGLVEDRRSACGQHRRHEG
ncbi:MAG: hypothetical protein BWY56_02492 [Acidobacteria bacterium ADurb.Bin340]|nr:MAG: hypothetical protein BWY56_02492 [Acidobacteria bacterium ADurb.Bin340]